MSIAFQTSQSVLPLCTSCLQFAMLDKCWLPEVDLLSLQLDSLRLRKIPRESGKNKYLSCPHTTFDAIVTNAF